jgi:hypothetical protein
MFVGEARTCCSTQKLQLKIFIKMSAEMLAKQYSMFCAIYFMLAHLMIAQIG